MLKRFAANGRVYRHHLFFYETMHERKVSFLYKATMKVAREDGEGTLMFGYDHQAGSVAVKTMHESGANERARF